MAVELERYDPGEHAGEMWPCVDGEWVDYDEVMEIIDELEKYKAMYMSVLEYEREEYRNKEIT